MSTLQLAAPGSQPSQIPYKLARSASGQMRIDYGTTSVITNPATGVTTMIDHAKQEFRAIPASAGAQVPQMLPPGMPGAPGAMPPPGSPAMVVKDLGVRMVQGIEVHGQQITMPPMAPPAAPAAPQVPGMAAAAAVPKPGQVPMIAETWVSTKLQMPVLSRITGSFGQQMCQCKNTVAGEPPASTFQVPPGYKQVGLPQPPAAPAAPAPPAMPAMPAAPRIPSMPGAPAMPAAPKMPAPPAAPAAPAMPSTPKPPFKF